MKTELVVNTYDASAIEVRYDLGPGQYMFAGWVPEGASLLSASARSFTLKRMLERCEAVGIMRYGPLATRQPEPHYRVKRGRGGRRKRRAR